MKNEYVERIAASLRLTIVWNQQDHLNTDEYIAGLIQMAARSIMIITGKDVSLEELGRVASNGSREDLNRWLLGNGLLTE